MPADKGRIWVDIRAPTKVSLPNVQRARKPTNNQPFLWRRHGRGPLGRQRCQRAPYDATARSSIGPSRSQSEGGAAAITTLWCRAPRTMQAISRKG